MILQRKTLVLTMAMAMAVIVLSCGCESRRGDETPVATAQGPRVAAKSPLDTIVPKLDFEDVELGDVIVFLRGVSGANIDVRWRSLAMEGLGTESVLSVSMSNVTLREVLDAVLKSAADQAPRLGYEIDEGVIVISSNADLDSRTLVGVYDIGDVIAASMNRPGNSASRREIITYIRDVICNDVDLDSWRDAGGEAGAIGEICGQLVITQTRRNHAKVHELINKMRRARLPGAVAGKHELIAEHCSVAADPVLRKKLDAIIANVEFNEAELSGVIETLQKTSDVNIYVNWRALVFESVEPATTVSVHLKNVTFRKALETVLAQVATGGGPAVGESGLGYSLDDGVITVSTNHDLGQRTVIGVYDVDELVRSIQARGGDQMSRAEAIRTLQDLIQEAVDRDSWVDAGGDTGRFSAILGRFVITQTEKNHAKIHALINTLVRAIGLKGPIKRLPVAPAGRSEQAKTNPELAKVFATRISKMDFYDMELQYVFDFLGEVSETNIYVDWRALAAEEIKPETGISVHLSMVTFAKALETVLARTAGRSGAGVEETGATYSIDGNVITITTRACMRDEPVVCVYNIRDIIAAFPSADRRDNSREMIVEKIMDLFRYTVDPDTWREVGGEAGAMCELGGLLAMTQTRENHAVVLALLNTIGKSFGISRPVKQFDAEKIARIHPTKAQRDIQKLLEMRVSKLQFDKMELKKAIEFLAGVSGTKITVNWPALAKAAIKPQAPVSMDMSNVAFGRALKIVLEKAESGSALDTEWDELSYVVRDGVVNVSTRTGFYRHPAARVYDISDMIDLDAGPNGGSRSRVETVGWLGVIVSELVDRDTWRDAGGEAGLIKPTARELVIVQAPMNHVKIVELLNTIRRAGGLKGPVSWRRIDIQDWMKRDYSEQTNQTPQSGEKDKTETTTVELSDDTSSGLVR